MVANTIVSAYTEIENKLNGYSAFHPNFISYAGECNIINVLKCINTYRQ